MKFFHLSDLHIGKQLKGYSLRANQEEVLKQIVNYAKEELPDALLICGDIYDKAAPSGEAFQIFDSFLTEISKIKPTIPVMIIAGNHDSPDRLAYAGSFLERHHIYISVFPPREPGEYLKKVTLEDAYGPVHFYLMPFVKPGYLRRLEEAEIESYESAVETLLKRERIDKKERNVMLSHQFYAGKNKDPEICDSEQSAVMAGGLDRVGASLLEEFDYAALGHLHGAQSVGSETIRYCGTPYKYSTSEEHHKKAITVVELGEKGEKPELRFLPLTGIQDVRTIRGTMKELLSEEMRKWRHDFVSILVREEEAPYRMREQLLEAFDHLLDIKVDSQKIREFWEDQDQEASMISPMEAFRQFYETVRSEPMSQAEVEIMEEIFQEAKEGEFETITD